MHAGENVYLIYTIGHSTHTIEYFIELLKKHHIDTIIDVRSTPGSSFVPQFNKGILINTLKKNNINYRSFADEFGARQKDNELLDSDGKVDFEKLIKTKKFLSAIAQLQDLLNKEVRIALMCSEADPTECHRFSVLSHYLVRHNFCVKHILKDGRLVENKYLEKELLEKFSKQLPRSSLFKQNIPIEELIDFVYKQINKKLAYSTKQPYEY